MGACRPDVVVHQLTDLREQDSGANARLRREGTANLIAAAIDAGVGRVVAQSIAWAYAPTEEPAVEDMPLDLSSTGARLTTVSAVDALETAVLTGPNGVVLRYGMLYGPGTWFTRTGSQARAARDGRVTADRSATSFVHVEDAAAAAVDAIEWPSGAVNIVDDEPARALDWVPDFCRFAGAPPPRVTPGRVPWATGAANTLARSLGWVPRHPTWRGNWGMCSLNLTSGAGR
jgi:nucleoside-diphosphate-sugar epimerase